MPSDLCNLAPIVSYRDDFVKKANQNFQILYKGYTYSEIIKVKLVEKILLTKFLLETMIADGPLPPAVD